MRIISLNSGSNGNAIYVESSRTGASVLLDCGISRLRIEKGLQANGRNLANVGAVFITHEHQDHMRGLEVVTKRFRMPVYITEGTWRGYWNRMSIRNHRCIGNRSETVVDDMVIRAFPKSHDAADPVFFTIDCDGERFTYATDLGAPDDALRAELAASDAALVEFNYDYDMLMNGAYPEDLKARVDSRVGHLSNAQACDLLRESATDRLRLLMPGHISEQNNTHAHVLAALATLRSDARHVNADIVIASRYGVGEIIEISG